MNHTSQLNRKKISVSVNEGDLRNYDNTDIRDGLLSTFSRTAKFGLADLKLWKDKIQFSELCNNPHVDIDDYVLQLFEQSHNDSFSDNKHKWDKAFYQQKVQNLTHNDFLSLLDLISKYSDISFSKSDEKPLDYELPF